MSLSAILNYLISEIWISGASEKSVIIATSTSVVNHGVLKVGLLKNKSERESLFEKERDSCETEREKSVKKSLVYIVPRYVERRHGIITNLHLTLETTMCTCKYPGRQ